MRWLNALEMRLSRFAIPGLIRVIVLFNALVYALQFMNPGYIDVLMLRPDKVMQGEVWRLVSYIFIPPPVGPLWVLCGLLFMWWIGEGLEAAWGALRLNLFYLFGMIGTTIAAFFFGGDWSGAYLNLSLLFAFATLFPDEIIYLFFVLPIKMRWFAMISLVPLLLVLLGGSLSAKAAIVASFINYIIFFGPRAFRDARDRHEVSNRRRKFREHSVPDYESLHDCVVCRRTEFTHPDLEFRVAADGNEYCTEHLPARTPPGSTRPA